MYLFQEIGCLYYIRLLRSGHVVCAPVLRYLCAKYVKNAPYDLVESFINVIRLPEYSESLVSAI